MDQLERRDSRKSTQSKPRTKSICCCCCMRESRGVVSVEDQNGIRLTFNTEEIKSNEIDEESAPIQSFPQDLSGVNMPTPMTKRQKCSRRCLKCCKKFTTFLFSNIGLCSAVVAYSILGGFIFKTLEAPTEILIRDNKRTDVFHHRKSLTNELWDLVDNPPVIFYYENFTRIVEKLLIQYQHAVLNASKNGWDGLEVGVDKAPQWSFAGSLLYSVTVITTIGYGHIFPRTFYGQLVTMFYALFGIPLTLLCLANLGSVLGNCFRLLYKHTCRLFTWMCCPPTESFSARKSVSLPNSKINITKETDPLRSSSEGVIDGNTLQVITINQHSKRKRSRTPSLRRSRSHSPSDSNIDIIVDDFDKAETKVSTKTEHIRVPIFVSLMIISLYILGGALMFSLWEDWNYLEGSYFCFITLSTIGFGDYVPGSISGADSTDNKERLIICCVYLMFGLSLLAMCFNLMQEDVRAKFLWLAVQIGLIDK